MGLETSIAMGNPGYRHLGDFPNEEEYEAYVYQLIEKDMRVICIKGIEGIDLYPGERGTVIAVNQSNHFDLNIKVSRNKCDFL